MRQPKIWQRFILLAALGLAGLFLLGSKGMGSEDKNAKDNPNEVVCPSPRPSVPVVPRSEVYTNYPFKPGEESKYELKYGAVKVLVGYGFLRVSPPLNYGINVNEKDGELQEEKRQHMVFQAEAYTGDWYKMVFAAHDKLQAYSRPWDFGISRFYMSQDEEKPFVRRYRTEKWLDFDHQNCKVKVREKNHTKSKESNEAFDLSYAAIDALGATFKLRTFDYQLNKPERFMVYTDQHNWWLEATPLAFEKVKVNAGEFETVKLGMKTYLGKELQQRGELYVWVAHKHPSRPLVKVEGTVTFGNIYLLLDSFKPGN